MTVRQIRDVKPSPDGKRLAFVALDRVWTMDLPSGTPKRLTADDGVGEFQPAWSPDGQHIAYVTWNDIDGGTVSRMRATERAAGEADEQAGVLREAGVLERRAAHRRRSRSAQHAQGSARSSSVRPQRRSASSSCGCRAPAATKR